MVWCPVLMFSSAALTLKDVFQVDPVFSVISLTLRYHGHQRGTHHHWSVLVFWHICDLQTDRPLLLFALYSTIGSEISDRRFTRYT